MESIKCRVDDILQSYTEKKEKFSEGTIAESLRYITKDRQDDNIPTSVFADILAFEFSEDYQDKSGGWGLYFGPKFTYKNEDGEVNECPALSQINSEVIEFWKSRSDEPFNQIILARYNSLVWEFSKKITGVNPNHFFALKTIDNIISIAKENYYQRKIGLFRKLEYALLLSQRLNDTERIKAVYETLIWFEDNISEDDKLGLWGYAFELLNNKKIALSDSISIDIITKMEERLERLFSTESNPWAIEKASILLANYYRKHGKHDDVKRVLLILKQAFDRICIEASPIQVSSWQQNIYRYFKEYGLATEADKISVKLQKLGPEMVKGLKKISHTMEISSEEMDNFLKQFTDTDLNKAYVRIAEHFIPRKNDLERQLNDLFKSAPLSFLMSTQIIDHNGRPIATVGSLEDDKIGNVIHQMSQNISISAMFLRAAIEAVINKFSVSYQDLVSHLYKSPAFSEVKRPFIELGIKQYFDESYANCIHILVPQIEDVIRTIIDSVGGSVLKPSRTGGFNCKILDELLRDDVFLNIFDDNTSLYLRVLLTDIRGWNIRNNLCHGLIRFESLNQHIADRLIHVLLLLALVKEKENR